MGLTQCYAILYYCHYATSLVELHILLHGKCHFMKFSGHVLQQLNMYVKNTLKYIPKVYEETTSTDLGHLF